MALVLSHNAYGKSRVRLTRITRHADRHDLTDWSVDVQLEGDFTPAYTAGDNRQVVATDTMKNRVYVLAADAEFASPESFAIRYGADFLADYAQVTQVTVRIVESDWRRLMVDHQLHPHAFVAGCAGSRICQVVQSRSRCSVRAGIEAMPILKTTDSAFRDFCRDQYTTLPDTDDRILSTKLNAEWTYLLSTFDWNAGFASAKKALLDCFAQHQSLGVQHTLYDMGAAVLASCPQIDEVTISMPNQHRLPWDPTPFSRPRRNEVFITTDEPYGLISGTMRRS